MNVLEKILEEMNKIKDGNRKEKLYAKYPAKNKRQEILNIYSQGYEDGTDNFYNAIVPLVRAGIPLICSRRSDNDELIDRKALQEEIESLTMTITGMRNGKTMTIQVLEEYKKSILRIIDEQPTVHANDNWIPADQPPKSEEYVLLSFENFSIPLVGMYREDSDGGAYYVGDDEESCISHNVIVNAWMPLPAPYRPDKCHGCFGAANNDCGKCEYGGGSSE